MTFEEIKAGLEKYTAEIDEEKRNAVRNLSVKYIIKEHSVLINDGNNFYVYAHYPTTEPDVMVMPFVSKVNAELFCEALNAENECREAVIEPEKHGKWLPQELIDGLAEWWECSECECVSTEGYFKDGCNLEFCPWCGAKMEA